MEKSINGQYRYYAFISYKREDEEWAKWLQHKLEHYKLPSNLNGRTDLPKEIRPVFKDTSELTPGNLPEQISKALEQSKYLIVICSRRSAQSEWVNKEVEAFKSLGKTENIIPFIIDGRPFSSNPEEECFPNAILSLPREQEILGANINEMGRDAAAVKVVARMFDIRFDELWQRYEREQRHHRNIVISAVAVFAMAVIGVAFWMYLQRQETLRANWEMMENQARMVAEKSKEEVKRGNTYDAILALLEMIPQDGSRPFVPELEEALRIAYDSLQSQKWNYRFIEEHYNSIHFSYDDNFIVCENDTTIEIFESKTLQKTAHFDKIDSLREIPFFLSHTNDTIFFMDSLSVMCYTFPDGRFLQKMDYTENVMDQCANSWGVDHEKCPWVYKWEDSKGIPDEITIIDYNPIKQWAFVYYNLNELENSIYNFSYALYDCNTHKVLKVLDPLKESVITSTSFSPAGDKFSMAFLNGTGLVIDLNTFSSKVFNCGSNSCDNYFNWLSWGRNGQLIHSSKYDIIKFFNAKSISLIDSIAHRWSGEIFAEMNTAGDVCLIGDGDTYMMCYKNDSVEIQTDSGGFERLMIPWDLKDTVINQRFNIICEEGNIRCKDLMGEYKEWRKIGRYEYFGLKGFIQNDKYMLVIGLGPMDRQYGMDIIDIATGILVYHIPPDFYVDCVYYNQKSELMAFGNEERPDSRFLVIFPTFDHLVSLCREATSRMVLSNEARRKFYLTRADKK